MSEGHSRTNKKFTEKLSLMYYAKKGGVYPKRKPYKNQTRNTGNVNTI